MSFCDRNFLLFVVVVDVINFSHFVSSTRNIFWLAMWSMGLFFKILSEVRLLLNLKRETYIPENPENFPNNYMYHVNYFTTAAMVQSVKAFASHGEGWVFEPKLRKS